MTTLNNFLEGISSLKVTDICLISKDFIPETRDLFIGCWRYPAPDAGSTPWLVLNNKETSGILGQKFTSVTQLLHSEPSPLLEPWPIWQERPILPATALKRMRLVVEDASADSVFSFILLLAKLAGVDCQEIPPIWYDAIDDWECTGIVDDPWTSWCALASALAHSAFTYEGQITSDNLGMAWTNVLHLLGFCLAHDISPYRVPKLHGMSIWQDAFAALRQEEQAYHDWLPHASVVQISLPLANVPNRRLLVDGLLFIEDQETGAAKIFYRNDKINSPGHNGFTLSAHYRPNNEGTGNDFTISVDPRQNVHVLELWKRLEELENHAWQTAGEVRPTDKPRDLGKDLNNRYTQPWYINPERTLIAAPRAVLNNKFGTRLSWEGIKEAIWSVYNPLRDVLVCQLGSDKRVPILSLRDNEKEKHTKKIIFASWPENARATGGLAARALSTAPIVPRALSGLLHPADASLMAQLKDLPIHDNWHLLNLNGGIAIVSEDGVFVLDDWRDQHLCLKEIRATILSLAILDDKLGTIFMNAIQPLLMQINEVTTNNREFKNLENLIRKVANVSMDLSVLRSSHATPPTDCAARAIWELTNDKWGLQKRLTAVETEIRDMETALQTLENLRTAPINRFIAIYGFPVFASGVFAPPLAKALNMFCLNQAADKDAPGWLILLVFLSITGLLTYWLHSWLEKENPLRIRSN